MVQKLIGQYANKLKLVMQLGQESGELKHDLGIEAAAILFIGSIQGLVMQSMLASDPQYMVMQAKSVFAVYKRALIS
jgi:hypothetical protein